MTELRTNISIKTLKKKSIKFLIQGHIIEACYEEETDKGQVNYMEGRQQALEFKMSHSPLPGMNVLKRYERRREGSDEQGPLSSQQQSRRGRLLLGGS